MADPEMTPLNSSAIKAYSYDPETRALRVKFPNGDIHEFSDVSMERVHSLAGADSPGRYFNERIRNHHIGKKIGP